MFSNFIYLLVALILYSTSQFPATEIDAFDDNSFGINWAIAVALFFIFWLVCRFTFKRLELRALNSNAIPNLDHHVEKSISRLSIFALVLFACDLYLLRLNFIFQNIALFKIFPTLEALIFLSIFILYLVIVWHSAWSIHNQYFTGYSSKRKFVISNISFSLPALLPWFILSFTADLIELIPFKQPKGFLATPLGEISYVLTFMVAVACFGPFLIQKIWGCTPLEEGYVRSRIEALCERAKLKYSDILKWELFGGSMITAGVMGLLGKFRYILVTPAMVERLEPDELDAVIAHEIGHIQKHHIHFYLLFFAGYIASLYSFFDLIILAYYSEPVSRFISFVGISHESGITLMLSIMLIVIFLIYFRYVFGFFMRNFERQADIHVYSYLLDASALIRTFYKIAGTNRQTWDKPNWHHYSIKERVDFLNLCQIKPEFIEKHNRRVKSMVQIYLIALFMVGCLGYYFNFGDGKNTINGLLAEKFLTQQLKSYPHNIDTLILAADYYYDKGRFDRAISYYNLAIEREPQNSHALNNLAWLHATCPDPKFQDYKRALSLAQMAVDVEKVALDQNRIDAISSHILDTYAEACFVNGLYREALKAAQEAFNNAKDKQDYYKEQIDRFKKFVIKDLEIKI